MALSFGGISDGSRSSWLDDDDGGDDLKFIYSEKATKFCEMFSLLFFYVVQVKSKLKILQNFLAFSEYLNFK